VPARLDSQLAKNFDASAAAIERVRPDVQIEAFLLFGLGAAPERVRLLEQSNGFSAPGDKRRRRKPRHATANNSYIAVIFS
jgi:hypothetical protein